MPTSAKPSSTTRRGFLLEGAALAAAIALDAPAQEPGQPLPWYRRAYRWGQTNITEKDPVRYDIPWWRSFWKRTEVQAVIINAGGIVAYYPSKFPLHHRAEFLNGRDLFIRERGARGRVPIHHPFAAINQTLLVEIYKYALNAARIGGIHREAFARPIA